MKYIKSAGKMPWWDKGTKIKEVGDLADKIRSGEESYLEEYHACVKDLAERTQGKAIGKFTDPLMHDELVEKWGKEPSKIPGTDNAPSRLMNYNELRNFMRGYWR